MDQHFPADTPQGIVYTPAYALHPGTRIIPLGLISPKRNGTIRPSTSQQTRDCLLNLSEALATHGSHAKAFKITRFMIDAREVWQSQAGLDAYFGSQLPASTLIETPGCSEPGIRIEFDMWAAIPAQDRPGAGESRRILDFVTADAGDACGKGVTAEVNAALDAVTDRTKAAGATSEHVVKLTVYLADVRLWPSCQEVILWRYGSTRPALVPIAVPKVLQQGASVEIEVTLVVHANTTTTGDTSDTPVKASSDHTVLAISGQPAIPVFIGGNEQALSMYTQLPDASVTTQTYISLRNLEHILKSAGSSWDHVFKTTWYVTDVREWPQIEEVAVGVLGRPLPNPIVAEVAKLVASGVRVEPDIWAVTAAT